MGQSSSQCPEIIFAQSDLPNGLDPESYYDMPIGEINHTQKHHPKQDHQIQSPQYHQNDKFSKTPQASLYQRSINQHRRKQYYKGPVAAIPTQSVAVSNQKTNQATTLFDSRGDHTPMNLRVSENGLKLTRESEPNLDISFVQHRDLGSSA